MAKQNTDWMSSVSDLMSGLMIIFMFIAISYMIVVENDKQAMSSVADAYQEMQIDLYNDLKDEFNDDFEKWDAELDSSNTVRFREPEVLFEAGSAKIKRKFMEILNDFWPRYLAILTKEKYKHSIDEVRIEGHTSSDWSGSEKWDDAYLNNAQLSQERSFNVLSYCYSSKFSDPEKEWLIKVLRANGLSFAKIIKNQSGDEDFGRSRRVEFRVISKTEDKIKKILEISNR